MRENRNPFAARQKRSPESSGRVVYKDVKVFFEWSTHIRSAGAEKVDGNQSKKAMGEVHKVKKESLALF